MRCVICDRPSVSGSQCPYCQWPFCSDYCLQLHQTIEVRPRECPISTAFVCPILVAARVQEITTLKLNPIPSPPPPPPPPPYVAAEAEPMIPPGMIPPGQETTPVPLVSGRSSAPPASPVHHHHHLGRAALPPADRSATTSRPGAAPTGSQLRQPTGLLGNMHAPPQAASPPYRPPPVSSQPSSESAGPSPSYCAAAARRYPPPPPLSSAFRGPATSPLPEARGPGKRPREASGTAREVNSSDGPSTRYPTHPYDEPPPPRPPHRWTPAAAVKDVSASDSSDGSSSYGDDSSEDGKRRRRERPLSSAQRLVLLSDWRFGVRVGHNQIGPHAHPEQLSAEAVRALGEVERWDTVRSLRKSQAQTALKLYH
eukprot:gene11898-8182_t